MYSRLFPFAVLGIALALLLLWAAEASGADKARPAGNAEKLCGWLAKLEAKSFVGAEFHGGITRGEGVDCIGTTVVFRARYPDVALPKAAANRGFEKRSAPSALRRMYCVGWGDYMKKGVGLRYEFRDQNGTPYLFMSLRPRDCQQGKR